MEKAYKKLKMRDTLSNIAWRCLTAAERRAIMKVEQAMECSGWRQYGVTCRALVRRIPEEWWERYPAEHIGEVMRLLKTAYDDGMAEGSRRAEMEVTHG